MKIFFVSHVDSNASAANMERWHLMVQSFQVYNRIPGKIEWIFFGLDNEVKITINDWFHPFKNMHSFVNYHEDNKILTDVPSWINHMQHNTMGDLYIHITKEILFYQSLTIENIKNYTFSDGRIIYDKIINTWADVMAYQPFPLYENIKNKNPFLYWATDLPVPIDIIEDLIIPFHPYNTIKTSLVSCVMVTKNRLPMVKKAVGYFLQQTYHQKELIIIEDGTDGTYEYITNLADRRIKIYHFSEDQPVNSVDQTGPVEKKSLGTLRNLSIEKTTGDYIMQWDDDDYYHPCRISIMMKKLLEKNVDVLYLSQWMMAWPERKYFVTSYYLKRGWEGSMLIKKSKMLRYPDLARGEDTVLQNEIHSNGTKWAVLDGYEMLYLYVVHGTNTWNSSHFDYLFKGTISLHRTHNPNVKNLIETLSQLTNSNIIGEMEDPGINYMFLFITLLIIFVIFIIWLLYYLYMK